MAGMCSTPGNAVTGCRKVKRCIAAINPVNDLRSVKPRGFDQASCRCGIDPEQFRIESMVDRMDTLGKTFLGLTINCCQCHNHKFDPITQREYYQMFAFLNNDDEPEIEVPSPEQRAKRTEILARVKATQPTQ